MNDQNFNPMKTNKMKKEVEQKPKPIDEILDTELVEQLFYREQFDELVNMPRFRSVIIQGSFIEVGRRTVKVYKTFVNDNQVWIAELHDIGTRQVFFVHCEMLCPEWENCLGVSWKRVKEALTPKL